MSRTRERLTLAACGIVVGTLVATGPTAVLAAMGGGTADRPAAGGTSATPLPDPVPVPPLSTPDTPAALLEPETGSSSAVASAAASAASAASAAADAREAARQAAAAASSAWEAADAARRAASDATVAPSQSSDLRAAGTPDTPDGEGTPPGTPGTGAPGTGTPGTGSAAQALGWGAPTRVEEFNGTAPGPGWSVYDGPGHAGNGRRTPSAARVSDGALTITGDSAGNTAGMAWNPGSKYGRWEARMRAPVSDPSYNAVLLLWPDAENFPVGGEIDFMETGDPSRQSTDFFLHYGANNSQIHGEVEIDLTQWHDWAVEWGPDHVTAFVDGKRWFHTDNASILPPGPMHMTIQLDWFPKGGSVQPSSMQVDWVRFYPIAGSGPSPAPLDSAPGAPVAAAAGDATAGSGGGTTATRDPNATARVAPSAPAPTTPSTEPPAPQVTTPAAPEPVSPTPVTPSPSAPDPAQPDPAQPEPAQLGPAQFGPAQLGPATAGPSNATTASEPASTPGY